MLTIPGVAQYTIHGFWSNGRAVDNVFDFQIDTTGSALSREEEVEDQAERLISAWQEHVMNHMTNNYFIVGCSWVDLDDEDGSTGQVNPDPAENQAGTRADPSAPPNLAYLVRKNVAGRRGTRAGRFYVAGVDEAMVTEDGVVNGAFRASFQTSLDAFYDAVNFAAITKMVVRVLPPRPAPPLPDNRVGEHVDVTSLALDSIAATQRRRMRG